MYRAGHVDLDCCKAVLRSLGVRNRDPLAAKRWMEHEMPRVGAWGLDHFDERSRG